MHVWGQDCLWLCINIFFSGYASFPTSKLFVCCTERGCSSHWKWIFISYPLLPLRALPRPPLLQNQLPLPLSLEREIHGFNSCNSLTFLHGNLRMDVGLAIKKQQQTHGTLSYLQQEQLKLLLPERQMQLRQLKGFCKSKTPYITGHYVKIWHTTYRTFTGCPISVKHLCNGMNCFQFRYFYSCPSHVVKAYVLFHYAERVKINVWNQYKTRIN